MSWSSSTTMPSSFSLNTLIITMNRGCAYAQSGPRGVNGLQMRCLGLGPEKVPQMEQNVNELSGSRRTSFCASGVARAHSRANTNAIGVVAAGTAANRACVLYRWLLVGT